MRRKAKLSIDGMTCSSCSATIDATVISLPGVISVVTTVATNTSVILFDDHTSVQTIIDNIEGVGFGACLLEESEELVTANGIPTNLRKLVIDVDGMTCTSCSNTVESYLTAVDGVLSATVVLSTNKAIIEYNASKVQPQSLCEGLEDIGFGGSVAEDEPIARSTNKTTTSVISKKIVMVIESVNGAVISESGLSDSLRTAIINDLMDIIGVDLVVINERNIQITFQDEYCGPRTFYNVLIARQVQTSACAMGGFSSAEKMASQRDAETDSNKRAFAVAVVLTVPLIFLCDIFPMMWPHASLGVLEHDVIPGVSGFALLLLILCTPVQFGVGMRFHRKAYKSILIRNLGMDFLVSTGTCAAYFYSVIALLRSAIIEKDDMTDLMYFETAAVLITVVLLGKFLESYARGVTASAIHSLSALRSKTARLAVPASGHPPALSHAVVSKDTEVEMQLLHYDVEARGSASEQDQIIDASFVHKGDTLRIVEGDSIPADGIVASTIGVDESMMTGESRVIVKELGDMVYGGTTVVKGSSSLLVTACGDDSVLGKIVATVQDAQASKPPIQELADEVARYFVPAIASISLLTFILWTTAWSLNTVPKSWYGGSGTDPTHDRNSFMLFAFLFSLSVWVSACPCAFGLATPTAVLVATGLAATHGVLVRKGAALQYAAEVDTVAFDKTGTLTHGKTSVSDFIIFVSTNVGSRLSMDAFHEIPTDTIRLNISQRQQRLDHAQLICLLLSAETRSNHPLAQGIVEFCKHRSSALANFLPSSKLAPVEGDLEVVPGQGIVFTTANGASRLLVGSPVLMASKGVDLDGGAMRMANGLRAGGKVALMVALDGVLRAVIGISDRVRDESAAVVEMLRRRGVRCYMITGDEASTAYAIGSVVGIPRSQIFASAKPKDKETLIATLLSKGRRVAFVGDGTNDSPALARASVGIAMSSGTSIAIEAGDMVLCKDDLTSVVTALDLSAKTMTRIKINYFWALLYNACLVPVAAGILFPFYQISLAPTLAGMAMAASSVSIVVSSLLLQLYRAPPSLLPESRVDSEPVVSSMSIEEKCSCPVSTAPKFQLTEESWSDKLSRKLWSTLTGASELPTFTFDQEDDTDSALLLDVHRSRQPSKESKASHSCSCGKANCRCGEACECGTTIPLISSQHHNYASI